jgi:hypothetical protein
VAPATTCAAVITETVTGVAIGGTVCQTIDVPPLGIDIGAPICAT